MGLSRYYDHSNNNNNNNDDDDTNTNNHHHLKKKKQQYRQDDDNGDDNNTNTNNHYHHKKKQNSKVKKQRFEQYLNDIEKPEVSKNRKLFLLQSDTITTRKRRERHQNRKRKRKSKNGSGIRNTITIVCLAILSLAMILIAGAGIPNINDVTFMERIMETMTRLEQENEVVVGGTTDHPGYNAYHRSSRNNDDDEVFTNLRTQMLDKFPEKGNSRNNNNNKKAKEQVKTNSEFLTQQQNNGNDNHESSDSDPNNIWNHLADTMNVMVDDMGKFTPFFFHVPRNGGQMIQDIVGTCLHKIQANEMGIRNGHSNDTRLQVVKNGLEGLRYVNVDVSSKLGIEHAAKMGFNSSSTNNHFMLKNARSSNDENNDANNAEEEDGDNDDHDPRRDIMVTSSYFSHAVKHLFTSERPGRAFIMLRNPISRAISAYQYQKSKGVITGHTLEEYANGADMENNWITRYLTNTLEGELKDVHLQQAKKILSKKFLIGFLDTELDVQESTQRMINYYGWDNDHRKEEQDDDTKKNSGDEDQDKALALQTRQNCIEKILKDQQQRLIYNDKKEDDDEEGKKESNYDHTLPEKGSQAHGLLSWQTQYDMKLYEFAKKLYEIQTNLYGSIERKKKKKKKRKKKSLFQK